MLGNHDTPHLSETAPLHATIGSRHQLKGDAGDAGASKPNQVSWSQYSCTLHCRQLAPGIEYVLQEVQEPHLFVIKRQYRSAPTTVTAHAIYYILEGGEPARAPDCCLLHVYTPRPHATALLSHTVPVLRGDELLAIQPGCFQVST